VLARPFFDINDGVNTAELTAFPGSEIGRVDVTSTSRLWGSELNYRCNLCCGCFTRLDFLGGLRFAQLTESLNINESVVLTGANPLNLPAGTMAAVSDHFGTRNEFFGGQVGLDANFHYCNWSVDLLGKIALGDTYQVININGSQVVINPASGTNFFPGGLLALPSNSGRFTGNRFSVLPELGIKLGYNVTDNLKLTVGYTAMYWSNVVRPGDQIDPVLNINQIPNFSRSPIAGVASPIVPFKETAFWAEGLTLGLEYNY
jgi:hypothetical protein